MAIKILIDSSSDINKEEAKDMGVELISMVINVDGEEYLDGDTLYPQEFYQKLINSSVFPKTCQITPYRWEEKLNEIQSEDDEVIIITMSSKLSGTYDSAVTASQNRKGVYVVDSLNVATGERILCEYALTLLKTGLSAVEIVEKLQKEKLKIKIIAVANTLEYLKKGGRISPLVAFAGGLLSVKPVLGIVDGEVKLLGKAIGSKKSNNMLNELIKKVGIDFELPLRAFWSGLDKTTLDNYVKDSEFLWKGNIKEVPEHILGCTIGTHAGPGAFGVAFFAKNA